MDKLTITIPGEPVSQSRPRFRRIGKHVETYELKDVKDWKMMLKIMARQQMVGVPLLNGPVALSVSVYRSIPKSFSNKKRRLAEEKSIRPVTKPDIDNYIKAIQDALTKVVWNDDSQIVEYVPPFGKYYSEKPRVEIEVISLDPVGDTPLPLFSEPEEEIF